MRELTPRRTIRARVLAIALVPSAVIVLVGTVLAGYLGYQGLSTRSFADSVRSALDPTLRFITTVQEERKLTTLQVTGLAVDPDSLATQRADVDRSLREMASVTEELARSAPAELRGPLRELHATATGLPSFRGKVDTGEADAQQVYAFYSGVIAPAGNGIHGIARAATDAAVGFEQTVSFDLYRAAEARARAHTLVSTAFAQGLSRSAFRELAHQLGASRELLGTVEPRMTQRGRQDFETLARTPKWQEATEGEDAVLALGHGSHIIEFDYADWEEAAREVTDELLALYRTHAVHAAEAGTSSGQRALITALVAGLIIFLAAAVAAVVGLRLSRRLVLRLTTLRDETFRMAERQLPELTSRLRAGDHIDLDSDVRWLDDTGDDEISQVATAFNEAQRLAIASAAQEVGTRDGIRAVFRNIAHRNQAMVHRQLSVLDKAERAQRDPDQLAVLFELDHLATQSRRNAENLLILSGRYAGRQWRRPVPLADIAGGAAAEAEHYTRVSTQSLPEVHIDGSAVADLIHLLAELIDNATAFSPEGSPVEVRGTLTGKGVTVDVIDHGHGIEQAKREELNAILRKPPEFGALATASEPRIGLFVVAHLAARHNIRVSLRESSRGGSRAVLAIPLSLVPANERPRAEGRPEATPVKATTNGTAPRRRHPVAATSNGATTTITVDPATFTSAHPGTGAPPTHRRAPLPRRAPQASIAEPLRAAEQPRHRDGGRHHADAAPSRTPDQFRASMSAFQRGIRRARGTQNPYQHGGES